MKNKTQRKEEALERQKDYNTLTTKQKIMKMDLKFGEKGGGKKQRNKLNQKLLKEKAEEGIITPGAGPQRIPKKNYQKPKKS